MAELKTKATDASVSTFISAIGDERRRKDMHVPTLRSLIAKSLQRIKRARIDYAK